MNPNYTTINEKQEDKDPNSTLNHLRNQTAWSTFDIFRSIV
ncbi:MAG: hypothetical protein ABJB05_05130 [Parafilimonas sp.]